MPPGPGVPGNGVPGNGVPMQMGNNMTTTNQPAGRNNYKYYDVDGLGPIPEKGRLDFNIKRSITSIILCQN